MTITVKKKTLKLKTDAPASSETTGESQPVLATMATSQTPPSKSSGSLVLPVVMALISCVLLGALLAIQLIENSFYAGM